MARSPIKQAVARLVRHKRLNTQAQLLRRQSTRRGKEASGVDGEEKSGTDGND